jgi:hypothetical protein
VHKTRSHAPHSFLAWLGSQQLGSLHFPFSIFAASHLPKTLNDNRLTRQYGVLIDASITPPSLPQQDPWFVGSGYPLSTACLLAAQRRGQYSKLALCIQACAVWASVFLPDSFCRTVSVTFRFCLAQPWIAASKPPAPAPAACQTWCSSAQDFACGALTVTRLLFIGVLPTLPPSMTDCLTLPVNASDCPVPTPASHCSVWERAELGTLWSTVISYLATKLATP